MKTDQPLRRKAAKLHHGLLMNFADSTLQVKRVINN